MNPGAAQWESDRLGVALNSSEFLLKTLSLVQREGNYSALE